MKFYELKKMLHEKLGIEHLADIARELGVSPQAVSNWKARNRVPYKYVSKIRNEIITKNYENRKSYVKKDSNLKGDFQRKGILKSTLKRNFKGTLTRDFKRNLKRNPNGKFTRNSNKSFKGNVKWNFKRNFKK